MEDRQIIGILMIAEVVPDRRQEILQILLDEVPSYIVDQQPRGLPGIHWLLEKIYWNTCEHFPEFLPCLFPIFSTAYSSTGISTRPPPNWNDLKKIIQMIPLFPRQPDTSEAQEENTEQIALEEHQKELDPPPADYHDIGGSE